jgi:hypothetical protein
VSENSNEKFKRSGSEKSNEKFKRSGEEFKRPKAITGEVREESSDQMVDRFMAIYGGVKRGRSGKEFERLMVKSGEGLGKRRSVDDVERNDDDVERSAEMKMSKGAMMMWNRSAGKYVVRSDGEDVDNRFMAMKLSITGLWRYLVK